NTSAFMNDPIISIRIADDAEQLFSCAFSGTKLRNLKLPNKSIILEDSVIENITTLESVNLGSTVIIPVRCFYGCTNLKTITGLANVTSFGSYSFSYTKITEVDISKSAV
ncbi:hypothetical protein EIN_037680, partial [Entamoeba invadens IP1]